MFKRQLILKIINKNCHLTLKILFYCNVLCSILSVHYSVAMFLFIIYIHYKEHDTDVYKRQSLDQVAEQTGVSKSMLAQIEKGTANPSIGVLGKITRDVYKRQFLTVQTAHRR